MRLLGVLLAVSLSGSLAVAMSIEEAYQLIPHRRTAFQAYMATMPAPESAYLKELFAAVDLAILAKVEVGQGSNVESDYVPVWKALDALKPPTNLQKVQSLFRNAIENEKDSLAGSKGRIDPSDSRAQLASQELHQAYDELMRLYPAETQHNKDAFFDYPCALDFF